MTNNWIDAVIRIEGTDRYFNGKTFVKGRNNALLYSKLDMIKTLDLLQLNNPKLKIIGDIVTGAY